MEVKTTFGKLYNSFDICIEGLIDVINHSNVSQKKYFSPYDLFYGEIEGCIEHYKFTSLEIIEKGLSRKPTYTFKEALCMLNDMGKELEDLDNYNIWPDIEIIINNSTINDLVDLYGNQDVLETVCGELHYRSKEAYYEFLKYIITKHRLTDPDTLEEVINGELGGPDIEEVWDLGGHDLVDTLLSKYTKRKQYNEMVTQIIKAILDEQN